MLVGQMHLRLSDFQVRVTSFFLFFFGSPAARTRFLFSFFFLLAVDLCEPPARAGWAGPQCPRQKRPNGHHMCPFSFLQ